MALKLGTQTRRFCRKCGTDTIHELSCIRTNKEGRVTGVSERCLVCETEQHC